MQQISLKSVLYSSVSVANRVITLVRCVRSDGFTRALGGISETYTSRVHLVSRAQGREMSGWCFQELTVACNVRGDNRRKKVPGYYQDKYTWLSDLREDNSRLFMNV